MELIHHFFELQRSFQRNKVVENDAPSIEVADAGKQSEDDSRDDKDLRGSIMRELQDLAIKKSETQTADQGVSADGVWGWDDDPNGCRGENYGYQNEGTVDNQWNEGAGDNQWNEVNTPNESGDHEYNGEGTRYPVREGAQNCAFYMKAGTCKFGSSCRFNHPPRKNQFANEGRRYRDNPEKTGEKELCKFFSRTGWCKHGEGCRYSHGSDKSVAPQSQITELNSSGYPIRPIEAECVYYMSTGSCKFGMNCKFDHPELAAGARGSSASSNSAPQAARVKPELGSQTSSSSECTEKKKQHNTSVEEYPERPGEPECSFFVKTGDCKFKSACKFHHPKNLTYKPKTKNAPSSSNTTFRPQMNAAGADAPALNDKGLPIRPGQPVCTHYYRHGICKYGLSCTYDHSLTSDTASGE